MISSEPRKRLGFVLALAGILTAAVPARTSIAQDRTEAGPAKVSAPAKFTAAFEENRGQYDSRVLFAGKTGRQTVFLTADEAAFVIPMPRADRIAESELMSRSPEDLDTGGKVETYALKMKYAGANPTARLAAENELEGKLNYFKGNDPAKWAADVPRYGRVVSNNVYPGIDMAWYGNSDGKLEYDLIVAPDADTAQIRFEFEGADRISVDESGDLLIETRAGTLRQPKPVIYQELGGAKRTVEGGYTAYGASTGFWLGSYDHARPLVIDPLPPFVFSTYLGGTDVEQAYSIKVDRFNNSYVAGHTFSSDFPITSGINPTDLDAFVTKLNPLGTAMVYSVLIGGNDSDSARSLALDSGGDVFITGTTFSADFPAGWLDYDSTLAGANDAFVVKLGPTGSSIYSTYLGGASTEAGLAIGIDTSGNAYVTGQTQSTNFPTTAGAYDTSLGGTGDIFVTKFNASGHSLLYSTYMGGSGIESGKAIAVNSSGNAYLTGEVTGTDFPVTPGSFSSPHATVNSDSFAAKFNTAGSALVYSARIGGDGTDSSNAIVIDGSGTAYLTGYTVSSNYPCTFGAYDSTLGAGQAAFVTKVNSSGSGLLYSTYLGGNADTTTAYGITLNGSGDIFVTGTTSSSTFPVTASAYDTTLNGTFDVFITKMPGFAFTAPTASTYIGGSGADNALAIAVNSIGDAFIVGNTYSADYPTTPTAFDTTFAGGPNGSNDGFVSRHEQGYLP